MATSSLLHTPAPNRERRQWTPQEDELLRQAVEREEPGNPAPSKWHAIAQHVPNRTNKDCRKRWYAKMSTDVVKGGWAPDEDQRLLSAIDCFGTRWSLVASMVQTRNSDQCAKRWCDTLNPAIDRTAWSLDADELLVQAVREHGTVWTKIVQMYFPGRTGLAAKNRYNSITRAEGSSRGSSRRRRSPDSSPSPSNDFDSSPSETYYYSDSRAGQYHSGNQLSQPSATEYHQHGHHHIPSGPGHVNLTGGHPIDRGHPPAFGGAGAGTSGAPFPDASYPAFSQQQHGHLHGSGYYSTSTPSMRYSTPAPGSNNNNSYPDYAALLSMGQSSNSYPPVAQYGFPASTRRY